MRQAPDLDIKRTYNVHVIFDFIDFHINILKLKMFNKTNARCLDKI